jgi:O-antigen/teichoic acid export membrane protein
MTTIESRESAAIERAGGLRAAAARNASVAGAMNIAVQVLLLVTYVILARLTTPTVFGVFAAGSILLSLGETFSESGMTAALLQRRERVDEAAATALASTFVGGIALGVVALALSPLVGLYFKSSTTGLVAAALSGYLVLNGVTGVPATLLQRRFALRRWFVEPLATCIFGLASGLALAAGFGVWGLVIGWYAAGVVRAAGYWLAIRWMPRLRSATWTMWRDLARFARHILAGQLLSEIQRVASTALIGRYLGPRELGEFRFGWRLVNQVTAPVLAANAYTIQPALVRLGNEPVRLRSAVLSSLRIVSLIALPLGAVFVPLGTTIAVVVLGEAWRGAGPIMMLLAGMGIAQALTSVPSEIFKARGRAELVPRMHLLWTGTSLALMVAFLPWGAKGVASAWSVSTVLVALYALSRIPRVTPVLLHEIVGAILPPLVCSALAVGAVFAAKHLLDLGAPRADLTTLAWLALELAVGTAVYLAAIAVLAPAALRETASTLLMTVRRRSASRVGASV